MSAPSGSVPLGGLAGVTLEELTARAGLQTRVDRKYVVPVAVAEALVAALHDRLDDGLRVLRVDGRERFDYASVYLDTPDLTCFRGAAQRRRRRFKVRTRTYLDSAACFVEVKTRGPRGTTVKTRVPYDADPSAPLTGAATAFVAGVLDAATVPAPAGPLTPALVTRYARRTFLLTGPAPSRVTVDTGLTWAGTGTVAPSHAALRLDGLAVVETKTGSTPSAADRLLWRHGHRPVRLSKYGTGMAVLDPRLPCTPWRPVLDRHVAPALVPAG
ncbi:polyphosphate polymerase domain-containing protein [Cellulomonas sp. zg-ZUI199]|uniref:Polyphosphate polymerase domain-containing protein n=1 Tax=Cellulomonas wangleii TaxID=2816956 RepID=A0ABX8D4Z9_9CELL|nr:polyphosphate polymerase domain-containing protein [Cellulomonas wangleii]MBO0924515.1 polyphosphate polymerase domain-containing protein [Cellulomonas wangleii]QVI62504.1 polyphosphate polymerase domain-containing protein [Cellulomonas wangleii]